MESVDWHFWLTSPEGVGFVLLYVFALVAIPLGIRDWWRGGRP